MPGSPVAPPSAREGAGLEGEPVTRHDGSSVTKGKGGPVTQQRGGCNPGQRFGVHPPRGRFVRGKAARAVSPHPPRRGGPMRPSGPACRQAEVLGPYCTWGGCRSAPPRHPPPRVSLHVAAHTCPATSLTINQ